MTGEAESVWAQVLADAARMAGATTVDTVTSGEDAIGKAILLDYDLITLDITMPEASGTRFYKEMRTDPDLAKIPVIIVTAVTGLGGDKYAYEKFISNRRLVPAPEAFFPKPIDREAFIEAVKGLLERSDPARAAVFGRRGFADPATEWRFWKVIDFVRFLRELPDWADALSWLARTEEIAREETRWLPEHMRAWIECERSMLFIRLARFIVLSNCFSCSPYIRFTFCFSRSWVA